MAGRFPGAAASSPLPRALLLLAALALFSISFLSLPPRRPAADIRESRFRTDDPDQAHLFFVPISPHKMRGKVACLSLLDSILRFISL
jgi:hypothetical protein